MTYKLNEKLEYIKPYEVIDDDCSIRLDANESFIDPSAEFMEKIYKAISGISLNRYPDDSSRKLREAFAGCYNVEPDQVVAGNGSDELIALIIGAFMKSGEKLMLLSPEFSMYKIFAETYERECIIFDKEDGHNINAADVIDQIKSTNARVLIFSNPASPNSNVMMREDVQKIIEGSNALIVVDEAYMDFSDQSVIGLAEKYDNLIVLKTCSKAFGCAAIRLGFAVSSGKITGILNALRPPYNLNSYTQAIGSLILSDDEFREKSVLSIKQSRDQLYKGLLSLFTDERLGQVCRSQTNFIYIRTKYAAQIFNELRKYSILVRHLGDSLRITAGSYDENEALISAMSEIINNISAGDRR